MSARAPAYAELAEKQLGLVTRRQLLSERALSAGSINGLVSTGRLVPVHPGVYRVAGAPSFRRQRILAAVLAAGMDACAARATAKELLELRGRPRETIHVLVPHDRRVCITDRAVVLHRSRTIDATQLTVVDGIPATDAARTICDLAIDHGTRDVREAAADALRRRLTTPGQIDERVRAAGHIRGSARLRAALASLDPMLARTRSCLEERARELLLAAGLPPPTVNMPVTDSERFVGEIDLAYPENLVGIEIDGYWWHSSPQQKARDDARQNALTARGWRIVRFGESDVIERPATLVATVRRALQPLPA